MTLYIVFEMVIRLHRPILRLIVFASNAQTSCYTECTRYSSPAMSRSCYAIFRFVHVDMEYHCGRCAVIVTVCNNKRKISGVELIRQSS